MKLGTHITLLLFAIAGSAQSVNIIEPEPNTRVVAGEPFNATVRFADTTSSVNVIALFFGLKANDPEIDDLGQTKLAVVEAPQFTSSEQTFELTLPSEPINGLNRTYNLTCGEFFTLGALNTPFTFTSQVPLFVTSS